MKIPKPHKPMMGLKPIRTIEIRDGFISIEGVYCDLIEAKQISKWFQKAIKYLETKK
jgi:hypothetical protein